MEKEIYTTVLVESLIDNFMEMNIEDEQGDIQALCRDMLITGAALMSKAVESINALNIADQAKIGIMQQSMKFCYENAVGKSPKFEIKENQITPNPKVQ